MIPASEYVQMLNDLDCVNGDFIQISSDNPYPLALLANKYHIHFMHYSSYEDAISVWNKRVVRMDNANLYVILVETSSCTYEDLLNFDKLPYKNKNALVHKAYPELKCAKVIKNYDGKNLNGEILSYSSFGGARLYDQVDWRTFLNL